MAIDQVRLPISLLQSIPQLESMQLRIMSDRLFVVLSKLCYAANSITPSNKLPPELLRTIFSFLCPGSHHNWEKSQIMPYKNLLAVSHVCRNWREIAATATELWAHIILGHNPRAEREVSIAQLCARRSGGRPLDFYITAAASSVFDRLRVKELILDPRRLRNVVYGLAGEAAGKQLASFLLPALHVERLEIRSGVVSSLPTLFSGHAPYLRELVLSRCTPWPNNQFGSLTSLGLLDQEDPDTHIYSLLDIIRCSPHLEEFLLGRRLKPTKEPQLPPEREVPLISLRSLKRLQICRLSARATRRLLGALDLLPNGISMGFSAISQELGATFPETITPEVSPRAATKLEVIYPPVHGVILHATNGVAHTRWVQRSYPGNHQIFHWIAEKPHKVYPLKELRLHIEEDGFYEVPPPHTFRDLETLVIETDSDETFDSVVFPMLSPDEDGVPFPLLSMLELQNVFGVAKFGEVLKVRSDAGFRLRALRMRWFDGCEAEMAPLAQFVDKLEFYYVDGKISRGLALPKECTVKKGLWEPWSLRFTHYD